jgi:hypothetical protein
MKERLGEILALRSVADALHQEDMVAVLGEVTILSDEYLPVLEFLMAPDNRTNSKTFSSPASLNVRLTCFAGSSDLFDQLHA